MSDTGRVPLREAETPVASTSDANTEDISDLPEVVRSQVEEKNRYLDLNLPPMYSLEEIFSDFAAKAMSLGFQVVLEHIGDRPLRVGTVCSGTESPIMAMELLQKGLGADRTFRFSHIFSCEIVPFKQAYIERNFRPPLLFRDLLELGNDQAYTAYGSLEKIPGDLDILIAGPACVDFSPLNNKQKLLSEGGESGSTFDALLRYVHKYRPRMVVMENVIKAPWDDFAVKYSEIGYHAAHMMLDSKHYYIPQTRTRGYLIAIDKQRLDDNGSANVDLDGFGASLKNCMTELARQASSPAGMFLLPETDRRFELIRKDLATRLEASLIRAEVNWDAYKKRHAQFRIDEALGDQRPISRTRAGDSEAMPPSFYWRSYFNSQVERVWETLDMKFLEAVTRGFDFNYKERWIDLSQGVDRGNESTGSSGVAGCLTPSGMPFVTTRGGPLSGLEALCLQGLPLDRIILTSESQGNLQDLAGNAMTSTTVCATMITALILGYGLLDKGADEPADARVPVDEDSTKIAYVDEDGDILVRVDTEDSPRSFDYYDQLLQDGATSAQSCFCEGQSVVKENLRDCILCGHRACGSCAGNPTHAYRSLAAPNLQRRSPVEFITFLKGVLPMRLMLSGLSITDFDKFLARFPTDHSPTPQPPQDSLMSAYTKTKGKLSAAVVKSKGLKRGSPGGDNTTITAKIGADLARRDFIETVQSALAEDVRFCDIERSDIWTVIYEGEHSSMQLHIRPDGLQWLYFAKAPRRSPARCLVREIFFNPIARMTPTPGTLLNGSWQVAAPLSTRIPLTFSGDGERVPAYQAALGITKEPIPEMKVWTQVRVGGDDDDVDKLDADVRGVYNYLPDCGTALASLYKKEATAGCRAVYLFLDPSKIGLPEQDSCVFSFEHSRLPGYSRRITIAELSHHWRATAVTAETTTVKAFYRGWCDAPAAMTLQPFEVDSIVYHSLQAGYTVNLRGNDCHHSYTSLVSLTAPAKSLILSQALFSNLAPPTSSASWQAVALGKSESELRDVAWAVQKIASRTEFQDWNMITVGAERPSGDDPFCLTCDPPPPGTVWGRDQQGRVTPYENPKDAPAYERAVKSKPAPFVLLRRVDEAGNAELRFTVNIQSMAHQAYGRLVNRCNHSSIEFRWRLVGNTNDWGRTSHPRFTLLSNQQDDVHHQPPSFNLDLREDQLRSLSWMVSQEADHISPFGEEETEEAPLAPMSWRAEVKVTMPRVVRGGVLCDEVGYGKTAIILGLIDAQYQQDSLRLQQAPRVLGQIATKATLLVLPFNVYQQWAGEIRKFLGDRYKVLLIPNVGRLGKVSVKAMCEADIILVPWTALNKPDYYQNMRYFTGTPKAPVKAGRDFDSWFKDANRSLRRVVQVLQEKGPEGYLKDLWARRSELARTQANFTYVPSRRLRGAAFAAAQEKARAAKTGTSDTDAPGQSLESSNASVSQAPSRAGPCPSPLNPSADPLLQPPKAFSPSAGTRDPEAVAPDDVDSSDENDGDFDLQEEEEGPPRKKAKRDQSSKVPDKKTKSKKKGRWDDREGFNIPALTVGRNPSLKDMKCLPLHAFSFNRIVVDEYTYSREFRTLPLLALIARSKWILSGTPALGEFADVKDIARHLGINLGIDNDGDIPTSNSRLKGARREQTALEAFEMHQPPRSMAWYETRHRHAQAFLDRFARQNPVDVSSLAMVTHLVMSDFLPKEEFIYQALYSRLRDDERRRRKNTTSDALSNIISKSESPAEALLRCITAAGMITSPLTVEMYTKGIAHQQKLRVDHWGRLESLAKMAYLAQQNARERSDKGWAELLLDVECDPTCEGHKHLVDVVGDADSLDSMRALLEDIWGRLNYIWASGVREDELLKNVEEKLRKAQPNGAEEAQLKKVQIENLAESQPSPTDDGTESGNIESTKNRPTVLVSEEEFQLRLGAWKTETVLKDLVCDIQTTMEQIVRCSREVRFFTVMQNLQNEQLQKCDCDKCLVSWDPKRNHDPKGKDDLTIIRTCGHRLCQGCMTTVNTTADENRICLVGGCNATACIAKQVSARSAKTTNADNESSKLNSMVDIIKNIPPEEKAVLFVQFEDAISLASAALKAAGIPHCVAKSGKTTAITTFVTQKETKSLPQQQEDIPMDGGGELNLDDQGNGPKKRKKGSLTSPPQVLILRLGSEMAAGLNLQLANHILFLSPLLASSQHEYDSGMTQAIGRCRRFGQKKKVHTYHLLTRRTAEVNVLQQRTRTVVVQRGTTIQQVLPSDVQPSDERCEGDTIEFASSSMPNPVDYE